jgi:hypothetical protein
MSGSAVPHHAESKEHKKVGIIIAVIAVVMTVLAALATNEANHMIVKEIQSSNGFAWYQAKRQRTYMNDLELKRIEVALNGNPTESQRKLLETSATRLKEKNSEYEKENDEIRSKAEADKQDADSAAHRHHGYEYGEIVLHIAIVLCSLMLLTESKLFLRLGLAATLVGVLLGFYTLVHKPHAAAHSVAGEQRAATAHH